MGSVRAELRRFEKRRLRPVLQRLKRRQRHLDQSMTVSEPMEQLLAALIRAEIRRAESKPAWSALATRLQSRFVGNQPSTEGELEDLVRTMLAIPMPPASQDVRRHVA
jgi:hypothetical protein